MARRVWLLLWLWLCPAAAAAHPLQFSYVDVDTTPSSVDAAVTLHAFDVAEALGLDGESAVFAPGFIDMHGARLGVVIGQRLLLRVAGIPATPTLRDVSVAPDDQSVRVRLRYPAVAHGETILFTGRLSPADPIHQTFLRVYERGVIVHQDVLTASRTESRFVVGATQTRWAVFHRFVLSGIEHIAIGPDHVLFVIGLLLVGGTLWQLVTIVTGFTLAHSVTLSLAALGIVELPGWLVEPAIALSICYVGIDNLTRREDRRDRRAWIAFAFGLVHGFGFASVLAEQDLPAHALGLALVAFNVGVELGQIAIVLAVSLCLAWLRRVSPVSARRVAIAGSILVIWAGFYWFVERVFFG